jgi:ATP-dependent RNA circularization protein (DNA/RNA ligase family)
MIEYPKIETLWNRDIETFNVIPTYLRIPEFANIKQWLVTEKIDGMNIRIGLHANGGVEIGGRTDRAQLPGPLVKYLQATFTVEKMKECFRDGTKPNVFCEDMLAWPEVVLFGEGYGAGIQKGGRYRPDPSFRLFDVMVDGKWLDWKDVQDIASKLEIKTVPFLYYLSELPCTMYDLQMENRHSYVGLVENDKAFDPEGIVARTDPYLYNWRGQRMMWKLKYSDFRGGK